MIHSNATYAEMCRIKNWSVRTLSSIHPAVIRPASTPESLTASVLRGFLNYDAFVLHDNYEF